jgi:hypothetical protein
MGGDADFVSHSQWTAGDGTTVVVTATAGWSKDATIVCYRYYWYFVRNSP